METAKEILKKSTVHTLSINEGSPLQDAVISAMKEYAECRTTQLKADKEELLEALEKISKATDEGYMTIDTDFEAWESELKQVHGEIKSVIQKHKP